MTWRRITGSLVPCMSADRIVPKDDPKRACSSGLSAVSQVCYAGVPGFSQRSGLKPPPSVARPQGMTCFVESAWDSRMGVEEIEAERLRLYRKSAHGSKDCLSE